MKLADLGLIGIHYAHFCRHYERISIVARRQPSQSHIGGKLAKFVYIKIDFPQRVCNKRENPAATGLLSYISMRRKNSPKE
jgi:hypothetical protein